MIRGLRSADLSRLRLPSSSTRWLTVAVIAVLGFCAISESLARIVARLDPVRAASIWPLSGRTLAQAAERLFADPLNREARLNAVKLARQALRRDATAVEAAAVLAMQARLSGETKSANRLFDYAQGLSRRELAVQVFAIQEAVERGELGAALLHYDIALRTSRRAPDLLFPVLARAIEEPRVRSALLRTLAARPVWTRELINYLAVNVARPRATVLFFREGSSSGLPILDAERVSVVNALASRGLTEDAWSYYSSFRGDPDRRRSRDPNFGFDTPNPATFDWIPSNEAGLTSTIQRGPHGGLADFSAPPGIGGPLLRQTQILPPGLYRLVGRSAGIDVPEGGSPYWTLTCTDGRELGRIALPNSAASNGTFSGTFSVPTGCPVQSLILMARAVDGFSGLSGQIERAILAPA